MPNEYKKHDAQSSNIYLIFVFANKDNLRYFWRVLDNVVLQSGTSRYEPYHLDLNALQI